VALSAVVLTIVNAWNEQTNEQYHTCGADADAATDANAATNADWYTTYSRSAYAELSIGRMEALARALYV